MTLSKRIVSLGIVGLLSAIAPMAHATSITYGSLPGSDSDGPLSAQAIFVTSAGQLQITLSNLLSAATINSQGQAVSGIEFTLSNLSGSTNNGLGTAGTNTASGQQGNLDHSGDVTYLSGGPGRFLGVGGGTFTVSGDSFTMEAIGGSQPTEMILPYETNGGKYADFAHGGDSHDPYTIGPATFDLAYSGITANTTVSSVTFLFGTGPDKSLGSAVVTPEPSSLLLLGTGILGAAGLIRRRIASLQS